MLVSSLPDTVLRAPPILWLRWTLELFTGCLVESRGGTYTRYGRICFFAAGSVAIDTAVLMLTVLTISMLLALSIDVVLNIGYCYISAGHVKMGVVNTSLIGSLLDLDSSELALVGAVPGTTVQVVSMRVSCACFGTNGVVIRCQLLKR
jgi:hypothetical protein